MPLVYKSQGQWEKPTTTERILFMKPQKERKVTPIPKISRVSNVLKNKNVKKYSKDKQQNKKKNVFENENNVILLRVRTVLELLLLFAIPILLFYLMESYEHKALEEVRSLAQLYNILLFELIAWILFFATGKVKTALQIETALACLYGIVNHYIMEFRSTPFVPWDIFSIKTAASVVDNYDFTPTKEMLLTTGVFVVIFLAVGFVRFHIKGNVFVRVIPMVCLSLGLGVFVGLLQDDDFQNESYLYPFLFTPAHMTKVNGMAVTFAMNLEYVYVEKPDGYSVELAENILEVYEAGEDILEEMPKELLQGSLEDVFEEIAEDLSKQEIQENLEDSSQNVSDLAKQETLPNLIVIMNEAFSDISVLGDFTTNEDYMPFLHSLQNGYENTITGNLTVSVCGGNTANSEFEFLTGHTMDFFPIGSIPYQQYIKEEKQTMARQLADLGYLTYGIHPYNASGWNRDTVYPNLGFAETRFLSDFFNRNYIRNYVSDKTAYEKIIEIYEQKQEGTPLFAFEVTMQNHGGYTDLYENFTPDIFVEEFHHPALDQYLSLIKVSDAELEQLISYFEKQEEDTVIVFFGDHQPSDYVVNPILRFHGKHNLSAEEAQLRYIVPYVIWANFDISEETNADTDMSYLGAKVLETAKIPTNGYQNFLLEMEEELKSAKEDGDMAQYSAIEAKYKEMHQILQYYLMFDGK